MLILEQLWQEGIDPSERAVRENSEYQSLSREAIEYMLQFQKNTINLFTDLIQKNIYSKIIKEKNLLFLNIISTI